MDQKYAYKYVKKWSTKWSKMCQNIVIELRGVYHEFHIIYNYL